MQERVLHEGQMRAERNWPWKRFWMKLLLRCMCDARASAATSSSGRPTVSWQREGGGGGGRDRGREVEGGTERKTKMSY